MHGAYVYDCPECGIENWQRCITEFLNKDNPEDAEAIELLYGLEALNNDRNDFRVVSHPNVVVCKTCGTPYKAISPGRCDDEDDDDDDEFDSEMEL